MPVLTDPELFDASSVRIAFTGRRGGVSTGPYASLNLGDMCGDDLEAVERNRSILLESAGACEDASRLIVCKQVHGTHIVEADDAAQAAIEARAGADGVVCTRSGVPVLLCFADCVPVIVVACDGSFSVLHAGWRGALAGICELGVRALSSASGQAASLCNAYVGPHIGACCYDVDDSLLQRFVDEFGPACANGSKLDLDAAVTASLVRGGIAPERIAHADRCTSCSTERYYSYRGQSKVCGRHGAFAWKENVR